jgi:hypothetical protein
MIDEKKFLERFAKSLGVNNVLDDMIVKEQREKTLLEDLNKTLQKLSGAEIKQVEEAFVEPMPLIEEPVVEQPEIIVEMGRQPEPELPKDDIVTKSVMALSKANQQTGNIQTIADSLPDGIRKEIDIIKKSIADFHRFAQNHSQIGGGGEVNLRNLDDVNRATIADKLYLRYDAASKKFKFELAITDRLTAGNYEVILAPTGQLNLPGANNTESKNARIQSSANIDILSNLSKWTFNTSGVLSVPGNIIPNSNMTYSLGNTTNFWNSVYSNNVTLKTLTANGSVGTSGQVLTSNSAGTFWEDPAYYGSFYYSGVNVALSSTTTAYVVPISSTYSANGIVVGSNNSIQFTHGGTYQFTFSIQYQSSDNDSNNIDVWVRKNTLDIDDSSSIFTVDKKNNKNDLGALIAVTPFILEIAENDKIQIMTAVKTGTGVSITTIPAKTSPTIPRTPAVIYTVTQIR